MQDFVNYIVQFVRNIFTAINTAQISINGYGTEYNAFLSKQIISGELINIGMTWRELLVFGSAWFLIIFFIVFIFHLVYKLIGLICLR